MNRVESVWASRRRTLVLLRGVATNMSIHELLASNTLTKSSTPLSCCVASHLVPVCLDSDTGITWIERNRCTPFTSLSSRDGLTDQVFFFSPGGWRQPFSRTQFSTWRTVHWAAVTESQTRVRSTPVQLCEARGSSEAEESTQHVASVFVYISETVITECHTCEWKVLEKRKKNSHNASSFSLPPPANLTRGNERCYYR